jgi:phage shock protein A
VAGKHLASTRLLEENTRHEDLADSIQVAVKSGRDDLAQTAIEKQLDIEAQIPVLQATIAEAGEREKELEGYVSALIAKRREMEQELDHFRVQSRVATSGGGAGRPTKSLESKVEQAENAFDRVLFRSAGLPKMRGADSAKTAAELEELEAMARKNRVQERLSKLKSELSVEG